MMSSSQRNTEDDKLMLQDLLGLYRSLISDWEANWSEFVLSQLRKGKLLSNKQAAVLDKTWAKYADGGKKDPTPKGNPSAAFANQKDNNSGKIKDSFDSYDEDAPF